MIPIRDVSVAPDGDGFTVQIGDEPPLWLGRIELILLRVQSDKLLASDQVLHEYLVTSERIVKGILADDPKTAQECSLTEADMLTLRDMRHRISYLTRWKAGDPLLGSPSQR
ncbi:hypothetical protein [Mycolicibacterium brumae]|uniref:Uncharacterized protein n=1 Tax=Mycolicibacterium brumae TaxID=85968 RepID=A0A2G5P8I6_9MYCO|nr:hypothetical protein [Mycolicibacterium brumae]MCV7194095.1 hypothetical protein [Mycolicibacterium brumae]PIB74410.1 hypothetical protein CQY22_013145 [Mycolicibacterium brumae]RWA22733.1 hypothetical protein MBRU_12345 [Mycolicibacterium brumae DSM 44177]UWW07461.1 hypothetical protein L2Z93_000476 [Mycolicibacterium brumae]